MGGNCRQNRRASQTLAPMQKGSNHRLHATLKPARMNRNVGAEKRNDYISKTDRRYCHVARLCGSLGQNRNQSTRCTRNDPFWRYQLFLRSKCHRFRLLRQRRKLCKLSNPRMDLENPRSHPLGCSRDHNVVHVETSENIREKPQQNFARDFVPRRHESRESHRSTQGMKKDFTRQSVAWLIIGSLFWGVAGAGMLNHFTNRPSALGQAIILCVLTTATFTSVALRFTAIPVPQRPLHCLLFPIVGLVIAVLSSFSNQVFYGW